VTIVWKQDVDECKFNTLRFINHVHASLSAWMNGAWVLLTTGPVSTETGPMRALLALNEDVPTAQ
jgi:hypothetical protein